MAQTIEEFVEEIGAGKPGFQPHPWYNAYGDCIHYHWLPDEFYAERVDDMLTVYRANETHSAVGCQIKGISALLKKLGEFGISINEQDGTPLAMFLFAYHAAVITSDADLEEREKTYRYLLEQVGKQRVEVPALPALA